MDNYENKSKGFGIMDDRDAGERDDVVGCKGENDWEPWREAREWKER